MHERFWVQSSCVRRFCRTALIVLYFFRFPWRHPSQLINSLTQRLSMLSWRSWRDWSRSIFGWHAHKTMLRYTQRHTLVRSDIVLNCTFLCRPNDTNSSSLLTARLSWWVISLKQKDTHQDISKNLGLRFPNLGGGVTNQFLYIENHWSSFSSLDQLRRSSLGVIVYSGLKISRVTETSYLTRYDIKS